MKNLKLLFVSLVLTFMSTLCNSQIIPQVNATSSYTLTPGQTTNFYDPSGPGGNPCSIGLVSQGNYSNCGCFTIVTINAAPGEFLFVSFNEFSMWNTTAGWDWMSIHDGATITDPVIFDNSAGGPDNPIGDCGIGSNVLDFCTTGTSMTFRFYATSFINRAGWDANVTSTTSSCGPLPIEIVEFEGYDDEDINRIHWVSASEINNDYYTIQRSEDGIHWETIATVKGAGNSTTPILYEIVDENPFTPYTYYSLSQTDFDGKTEKFDIIAVENRRSVFYIYRKGNDTDNLYLSSSYNFELYNMMGQRIRSGTGDSVYVGDIHTGIYIIKVGEFTQKFYVK